MRGRNKKVTLGDFLFRLPFPDGEVTCNVICLTHIERLMDFFLYL